LQLLQMWTEAFLKAITQSAKKMPYAMRYLARETLAAAQVRLVPQRYRQSAAHTRVQARFPNATQGELAACIGRLVYYRYINPAIV
jgi:Ras GTPase-activating-like protein IQGAP2/3